MRAWLLLAVGEDRQHGGNAGYEDDPARHYVWDSTVPHHRDINIGDAIAIWDKQSLIGLSTVEAVDRADAVKQLFKCARCGSAQIKARKQRTPKFRCFKCKSVFDDPTVTNIKVTTYRSHHEAGWIGAGGLMSGSQLRALCVRPRSQLSLRPLRWLEFRRALAGVAPALSLTVLDARADQIAGGHRRAVVRMRLGQPLFRRELLARFGEVCAFTGRAPEMALEAVHLYSYAASGRHRIDGGLLLRRDVHRLFDLGHISVEPEHLTLDVSPILSEFDVYAALHGRRLSAPVTTGHVRWLRDHWQEHRSLGAVGAG
jgi:hypothetical protein